MKTQSVHRFLFLTLLMCLGLATTSFAGGPAIVGGDDADDHGSTNGFVNFNGWLYIESGFDVIGPCVTNGNKKAVCLGCNGGGASGGFDSGFDKSNLPGAGWTRVTLTTAAQLTGFFDGSGATNVNNSGIIYMPTDAGNVGGGITAAQLVTVNANAGGISTFVTNGGGLFTHDQQFTAGGFGWLPTLIPGIVHTTSGGCNVGTLNLTPQGQTEFPQLTDAIMSNATPWHSWFSGNFGGFPVLVTGPCPNGNQPVILGGCIVNPGQIKLDPKKAFNLLGTSHTDTATVTDAFGAPLVGTLVSFDVISGPNTGDNGSNLTDTNGQATFTWTGDGGAGVDIVRACFVDTTETPDSTKCVTATKFWDKDCNSNGTPDHCDVACGGFAGACSTYFAPTCGLSPDVNGDNVPDECNRPPDCSLAAACVATLWPPNHKYQPVSICGVTDPDSGDVVTITVTGITQDEPLNTRGDGNTCPDGQIVGGQASVRAERTGTPGIPGNGRVYAISFTASDGKGGECTDTVYVCVPHDQGQGNFCIDDGQKYNSVGPCNGGSQLTQEITEVGLTVGTVTGSQAALEFALPYGTQVELSVFDVAGRRLATVENGSLAAGVYQRSWDMSSATKGLYFVRLRAGAVTLTKTVVKIR